jgi:hypothetical protein
MPDLPKSIVDWAQVAGAALSFLALAIALYAIYRAKHDLVDERRRQHELEILREIGENIEPGRPRFDDEGRVRGLIAMLPPERCDFPLTRAGLNLGSTEQGLQKFIDRYKPYRIQYESRCYPKLDKAEIMERVNADLEILKWRRWRAFDAEARFLLDDSDNGIGIFRSELSSAVEKRVRA